MEPQSLTIVIDDLERAVAQSGIAAGLAMLFHELEIGEVFAGRTRITSREAGLSAEPDVVAVLWDSVRQKKVEFREGPGRISKPFLEIEGRSDLVVEIFTEQSLRPFPHAYSEVGIPEVWIADLRDEEIRFRIHTLRDSAYSEIEPDPEGWVRSPRLGGDFRLVRHCADPFPGHYKLEHRSI